MTKYILQSGGIGHAPELKKQFHQEVVKDLGANPKILIVSFAQAREYWEKRFPGYCKSIQEDLPGDVLPSFAMAMPDTFVEQCQNTDILYFNGGDDHLLQYWMKRYNLHELFKDKVVATNSASTDMLATYHWTGDWRQCADGFGILPIKFIPHYQSQDSGDPRGPIDWQKAYNDLEAYGDTALPIHALKEGEYIVMEQL